MINPYKELAGIIQGQAAAQAGQMIASTKLELGTITATGLKLDTFKHEIQDYLVAEWSVKVNLPAFTITGTQSGLKDSQNGSVSGEAVFSYQPTVIDKVHVEVRPDLQPGDRVLCVPVNGGNSIIVLCKVVA